jgi:ribosome-associated protein
MPTQNFSLEAGEEHDGADAGAEQGAGNALPKRQFARVITDDPLSLPVELARLISDSRCTDVVALDVRGLSPLSDYLVIGTGTSARQLRSVASEVRGFVQAQGREVYRSSKDDQSTWTIIDCVDVVVHLFEPNMRSHYDLESMWGDAKVIEWKRPGDAQVRAGAPEAEGPDDADDAPMSREALDDSDDQPQARAPRSRAAQVKKKTAKKSPAKKAAAKPAKAKSAKVAKVVKKATKQTAGKAKAAKATGAKKAQIKKAAVKKAPGKMTKKTAKKPAAKVVKKASKKVAKKVSKKPSKKPAR